MAEGVRNGGGAQDWRDGGVTATEVRSKRRRTLVGDA